MSGEIAHDWPDFTGPLSLREACSAIGWCDQETGEVPTRNVTRLRRKMRAEERKSGRRYLFGGGKGGSDCWTTIHALAELKLLPDQPQLIFAAKLGFEKLHDQFCTLREQMLALAEVVYTLREDVNAKLKQGYRDYP